MKAPKKLLDKKVTCPNCKIEFNTKKPIESRLIVRKLEADGHRLYKDVSPLWYRVNVCPVCGFAFEDKLNNEVYEEDAKNLLEYFTSIKNFSNYCDVRTLEDAIRCNRLALLIASKINEPKTLRGVESLRTSWLYNEIKDFEKEKRYLVFSKDLLEEAFEDEDFEYYGLKVHILYNILANISKKLNLYEDASKYFSKLIMCPTTPKVMKQKAQNDWYEYNDEHQKFI